jgi:anti-sigma B factor antagonist
MSAPLYQLIRTDDQEGVPVVSILCTELRTDTVISRVEQELDDYLDKSGTSRLVLDLSSVHFMASTGLRVLISLRKRLQKLGGEFKMCGVHSYVAEVFHTTRLFTAPFDILSDAQSAAAALKAAPAS